MNRIKAIDKAFGNEYNDNGNHFHYRGENMGRGYKWGQKLAGHGFRLTAAREAILDVLSSTNEHVSAEDIYMTVHADNPRIGLTTIYRTLELLEQTGIICKFEFGHGRAKYELSEANSHKKHHHHLICKKCRKIIDYTEFAKAEREYIQKAETGLEKKYRFTIDDHLIHFYGICPECKTG
ncbi:MAG: transcriptional repressor [Spirochaetales bacterium]|nr:transcriptional repressor [Spirochaetales bacterium]